MNGLRTEIQKLALSFWQPKIILAGSLRQQHPPLIHACSLRICRPPPSQGNKGCPPPAQRSASNATASVRSGADGRRTEREKSIAHGSRKIRATPLHSIRCAGMQGCTGAAASCRQWNCSLWQRRVVCNIQQGRSATLGRGCGNCSGALHGLSPAPVGLRRDHHLSPAPESPDHGPARHCADSLSRWISGGERFRLGRTDSLCFQAQMDADRQRRAT